MPPSRRHTLFGLGGLLGSVGLLGAARALRPPGEAPVDGLLPDPTPSPRWQPGWHAGFNHAHVHRPGLGYGSEASKAELQRLRGLGVTHLFLTPFAYQPSLSAPELRWGDTIDRTLTDAALLAEAAQARSLGMQVGLKPHVWSNEFWGGRKSRQDIDLGTDAAWEQWFENMGAFAEHYAALGERMEASLVCVGLEYLTATRRKPGAWARVASRCRGVFSGQLTYAANWYEEVEAFADWEAFDLIGVNAWYPLTEKVEPDTAALVRGWQPHVRRLGQLAALSGKPVLLTEAGLRSTQGAAARPWDQGLQGPPDPALQARAYEALLQAFTPHDWFAGVYWWKSFTAAHSEETDDYGTRGKPCEAVLARWWG